MFRKRWFISGLIGAAACCGLSASGMSEKEIDAVFSFAEAQYQKATSSLDPEIGMPRNSNLDGTWHQVEIESWASGFFPGCLWLIYEPIKRSRNEENGVLNNGCSAIV